jgi:hypothetical protein
MSEIKVRWPLIAKEWDKTYFNYIDLGNYTMFRMSLYRTGQPRLGLFVAIEDKGSFFFSLENRLHKDYVAAKLGLLGDAGQVADFLNAQLGMEGSQQGHYYEQVIKDIEPYGTIWEGKYMPWHPEIIGDE